ncbi:MAG: fibronectin type III domain-containing protein [Clostridiales Family XIII bacterium]|jgi:uncharacterized repeat protein (TIGR02543 family)|nr:fibronectin type III domain-containing protein [Clostridiales Family XIII bacterium]
MQFISGGSAARSGWRKRAVSTILIVALIITSAFAAAWGSPNAGDKAYADTTYPPSSSENYFAAKFPGLTENNVFDNLTVERLAKGVLGQDGKSIIVLGSARNDSTKKTLRYIDEAAKAFGVKKIYFFDPHLAGDAIAGDYNGADITVAASRAELTTGKDIWSGASSSLTSYVSGSNNTAGARLKYIDAGYTSDKTYLFVYDRKAGGSAVVDSASTIVSDFLYDDAVDVSSTGAQTTFKSNVTQVFTDAGWTSGSPNETFYDQYHWFKDSGAWTAANYNPSVADLGISRENFTVKQVTWAEFINVLNYPGEHYFFCSGSWCGDSRNLYPYLIQEASRLGKTVYLIDFRANSGIGTTVSYFSSETSSVKNGISYIGAQVVDLLAPFDVGETNSIRTYFAGGDVTQAATLSYVNKTFRSPYAAKYTKPNSTARGTITQSWVNEDTELEAPYKTSSEWTASVHAPGALIDYEVQTGGINALQTAKARASLSEFFGSTNIHNTSGYAPTTNVGTNVSKEDSGCGDENDLLDDIGGDTLIPNQGTDDIDVQDYDITIEYDVNKKAEKDSVTGLTKVTATAQKDLQRIELDFKALAVDKEGVVVEVASGSGDSVSWSQVALANPAADITQTNLDDEDYQKIIVRLPAKIDKDKTFRISIPYTTGILDNFVADEESAQGFFKRVDDKGIAAIGEPLGAIYWFPNNNKPKDGAKYKITLKYPAGFTGVGPGVRTSVSSTQSVWQLGTDTASYQVFAAIGEYVALSAYPNQQASNSANYAQYITLSQPTEHTKTVYSGSNEVGYTPTAEDTITAGPNGNATAGSNGSTKVVNTAIPYYAYVNKSIFLANTNRNADKANSFTAELPQYIRTLESIAGPYPGESAGFVLDNLGDGRGGSAGWGAVETKDRPFFTGSNITSERTFVHEYAHQWYGDAVRIAGWEDLWLNEGFATYVTDLYYEETKGFDVQAKWQTLYANTAATKPWWSYAPAKIETEGDLFGGASAAYNRGALALAALRASVGDDDFSAILQQWPQEYKGKAATTQDFIAFAAETANVNLTQWANDWLYGQVKPSAWPTEQLTENGTVVTPTVTLDGGTAVTLPTIKAGEPIGTLPAPTKAGYTFSGWYVDDEPINATFIVPGTPFTLVAKWTPVTDTGNGGDNGNNNGGNGGDNNGNNGGNNGNGGNNNGTNNTGNTNPDADKNRSADEQTPSVVAASITSAKIAAIKNNTYTGKALKPEVKVTLAGKTLTAGTDYEATYANNTKVGKATVTVTGKGNYKDKATATFNIVPKPVTVKSLKAGKNKLTLNWAKAADITKYQLSYKLTTAKTWKTVSASAKATSKAVSKLKKNKKYQVRIRAYKTVNGKKYYSEWSKTRTVKVK